MSYKRKDYQRSWISIKRQAQKARRQDSFDSSDSEVSTDVDSFPAKCSEHVSDMTVNESDSITCNTSATNDTYNTNHVGSEECGERNSLLSVASSAKNLLDKNFLADMLQQDVLSSEEESWDALDLKCNANAVSCSESDDESCRTDIKSDLQAWAVECNLTHCQLDKLLPILRKVDTTLPATAKTLLKNDGAHKIVPKMQSLSGGDYLNIGVKIGLVNALKNVTLTYELIELTLNIDGVPLFNSSTYSLWPILCCASNIKPRIIFVAAIFGGKSKPSNLQFLQDTIDELNMLQAKGFDINGKHIGCKLKFCICDAVARCMVKSIKQFSGYFGCDKCCQRGVFEGRMTYPDSTAPLRNDSDFRKQINPEHHNGVSPFCALPINMIDFFPIDYMHSVCLGAMKRLLVCWTTGSKSVKLSASQKLLVNARLQTFKDVVTSDFCRKPRALTELCHWKATEFRTFLLYTGYFVMHKIMRADVLQHFLSMCVALRILVSKTLSADKNLAAFACELLQYFVNQSAEIYGKEFLVYNIHTLVHLPKEAELFGCLDVCSSFAFENFLQVLKKWARSGKNPVIQVYNRIQEHTCYSKSVLQDSDNHIELQHLSLKYPDNCCVLDDGGCCQVISKNVKHVQCMIFNNVLPVFLSPIDSRLVGIQKVKVAQGQLKSMPPITPACKAICYAHHNADSLVFIQLLHTF